MAGRPRKDPKDRRNIYLKFRVNEEEYERLEALAGLNSGCISGVLRNLINESYANHMTEMNVLDKPKEPLTPEEERRKYYLDMMSHY